MPPLCPIMHLQWDTDWTLEFTSQSSACVFRPYPVEGCDSGGERCVWLESTTLGSGEWRRRPCLWEQQGGVVWLLA